MRQTFKKKFRTFHSYLWGFGVGIEEDGILWQDTTVLKKIKIEPHIRCYLLVA
jgi:hypothetical protein